MREGLIQLVNSQPDLEVVAEAADAAKGLDAVLATKPDVAIIDITLPGRNGLELIKDIRAQRPEQIILDPGIGFGKTPEVNEELLEFAKHVPGHQVMIGYSRKRFLGESRMELEPNLAAGRKAIAAGADYLRVHDVAGHTALLQD